MKITDKVVTSKGRFGTITNISIDGTKAYVQMGLKNHEILVAELNLLSNTIPINVLYVDKFDSQQTHKTEVLNIPKNISLYDLEKELQNNNKDIFMDVVKLLLIKRLNNHDLLILNINLI